MDFLYEFPTFLSYIRFARIFLNKAKTSFTMNSDLCFKIFFFCEFTAVLSYMRFCQNIPEKNPSKADIICVILLSISKENPRRCKDLWVKCRILHISGFVHFPVNLWSERQANFLRHVKFFLLLYFLCFLWSLLTTKPVTDIFHRLQVQPTPSSTAQTLSST